MIVIWVIGLVLALAPGTFVRQTAVVKFDSMLFIVDERFVSIAVSKNVRACRPSLCTLSDSNELTFFYFAIRKLFIGGAARDSTVSMECAFLCTWTIPTRQAGNTPLLSFWDLISSGKRLQDS